MLLPAMREIPYAARRMYLCVDTYQDGALEGRFYSAFEREAFGFRSVLALLRYIDDFLDETMHIHRHEERRSLLAGTVQQEKAKKQGDWQPSCGVTGALATFSLVI